MQDMKKDHWREVDTLSKPKAKHVFTHSRDEI